MKTLLLILVTLFSVPLAAQNVQWSFKILDYSSQKTSREYAAAQALGIPNIIKAGVENIKAWEPKGHMKEEFIKVGFLNPIKPKQLIIVETFHPGYISKIFAYDADGKEYPVATFVPKGISAPSRILSVNTSALNFFVLAVKIVLTVDKNVPIGIDAIGITESDKPFKIVPNPNDVIKSSMVAIKLDTNVNSKYPEMGPLVSPDGRTLYFSRRWDPKDVGGVKDEEDIWYSNWDDKINNWGPAKNMGRPLNNTDPNFINSISPDGNTLLLGNTYLSDSLEDYGVSTSKRTSTGWSTPKQVIIEDDAQRNKSRLTNYFLSNSQKILLMSNNRRGDSYGDRDIYVSFPKTDSTWTKPLNLGKNINTKGTESAPFLAADDKTLYYTSDGLMGYGGSDIYISRRLDDSWTNWSKPENLGPIVNTAFDESYLTLNAAGTRVYFTSEITDDNDMDIYKLVLPASFKPSPVMLLRGQVIDTKTNLFIPNAKIYFDNLTTLSVAGIARSSPDSGNFQIILPSGSNYGYLAEKQGYISVHSNIDLTNLTLYKEYRQNIYLTPIEVGQTIIFHNIFFDFDKYDLKKASFLELDRLAGTLKNSTTLKIEISGNTDNVGTPAYNDKLSINRAMSVVNYLLAQSGVDKSRITMKHYGETNPVATNTTEAGRQLNRRVQFKILAK